LHVLRGENDEAEGLVERARKVWPNNSTLLAMAARLATLRGDHAAAIAALSQAIVEDSDNVELKLELGAAHWSAGDRREAAKVFRAAANEHPDSIAALLAVADAYYEQEAVETAESWYIRAYDAGASAPAACYQAGMQAMKGGDYARAEEAFKRGLAASPNHPQLNDSLARLYSICPFSVYRNGEEAVTLARRAHGDDDSKVSVHGLKTLAAAYAEAGDFAEAVTLIQRALERLQMEGNDVEHRHTYQFLSLYQMKKHIYEKKELLEESAN